MRAASVVGLLLALFLAGCADEPRETPPSTVTLSAGPPGGPEVTPPILEWRSLGVSSVLISPRATSIDVAIPAGALTIVVNQTFEVGAAYGIVITFGACLWDRPQPFVGLGQTIGADCGSLPEGVWPLQISTPAGALSATVEPVGLFCTQTSPGWRCPGASAAGS